MSIDSVFVHKMWVDHEISKMVKKGAVPYPMLSDVGGKVGTAYGVFDGVVAKAVIGPQSDLDKEYVVEVAGTVTEARLSRLRYGLELDGRQLKPARVTQIAPQQLRFILKEGRNRQIRRMCELVGLEVVDLYRIRIGPLSLGDLPEGRWRHLTPSEREALIVSARP